jgi:hypothetical protein
MTTPAGWYPDPHDPNTQRYFDGAAWTEQSMPAASPSDSPFPPPGMPAAPDASSGKVLSIIAMVCGAIALLFCPILLGPAGIVCGVVAKKRGESLATIGISVAAAGMILGFILGALSAAST